MSNQNTLSVAVLLLCSVAFTSTLCADKSNPGMPMINPPGFIGPDVGDEMSVQELLAIAKDDLKVIVKGHIIKRLSHDKYIFTDSTAEIVVEIDNKDMPPEPITPETLVKLYGKIDKDYLPSKIEIEVKRIEVQK